MKATLRKRLFGKKGFTLAETLLAILILLMVTAVVAAGIPVAVHAYEKVVMASNAQLLMSTTITRLRDELGTATNISVAADNLTISYTGDTGRNSCIHFGSTAAEGILLTEYADADTSNEEKNYEHLLVTESAATKSLYATYEEAAYDAPHGILTVKKLKIKEKATGAVLVETETVEIRILTDLAA